MKVFKGARTHVELLVTVDGRPLPTYLHEVNHSPDGFEWGYGGSGPAQLAYAILRAHGLPRKSAELIYQNFKFDVIATLPVGAWQLTSRDISQWLATRTTFSPEVTA